MVLAIAYDLHNAGRDYANVIRTIKSAPSAHPQGSFWLIDTTLSPQDWVKKLQAAGDSNDEYFVTQLKQNWWSLNTDQTTIDWLKSPSLNW